LNKFQVAKQALRLLRFFISIEGGTIAKIYLKLSWCDELLVRLADYHWYGCRSKIDKSWNIFWWKITASDSSVCSKKHMRTLYLSFY